MKIILLVLFLFSAATQAAEVKADNSRVNDRDKYLHEYTADQQGMNKEDAGITKRIRREITKDQSMSFYAKNIKIITINGQVTLKGPVRSADEVKFIVQKAQAVAGVSSVLNQLDVTAKIK